MPQVNRRAKGQTTTEQIAELACRTRRSAGDVEEQWSERAAMREFCGGQPRYRAEADALVDVRRMLEPQGRLA